MIKEDYVSFETAKLLKEKGFDEPSLFHCTEENNVITQNNEGKWFRNSELKNAFSVPTQALVLKWLREKHHIVIDVCFENHIFEADDSITMTYCYTIWRFNKKWPYGGYATVDGEEKNSYEEACEEAIKYCLENLI